jgi:predicted nucleic acid-binding protein
VRAFFDTNVLLYAASEDPRQAKADELLRRGGVISVQVLNEFANVSLIKLRLDWPSIETALTRFCDAFEEIVPLTLATHAAAVGLARDHRVAFYDALIVAAAREAGCDTLFTEDMQDSRRFGDLAIVNPFK